MGGSSLVCVSSLPSTQLGVLHSTLFLVLFFKLLNDPQLLTLIIIDHDVKGDDTCV